MRFTRRLRDRRSSAILLAACCLTAAAGASCSSGEEQETPPPASLDDAAGPETSQPAQDAAVPPPPPHDAAPFDGKPLPVECASQPCARALVTTLSYAEGYCARLDDGTVACWGTNSDGQLGRGEEAGVADSAIPARVAGLSDVVELDHTCARTANGDMWCWGQGVYVRDDAGVRASERAPVKVPIPPAKSIGLGNDIACAAIDDGVLCWGSNLNQQVAPVFGNLLPPTRIDLPPGAPIRDVLVGQATFVVREDGTTLSWGRNPPLARVSSISPDPYPGPTVLGAVTSIDLTSEGGCAAVRGTGYCWGAIDTYALQGPSPLARALPEPVVAPEPVVQIATTPNTLIVDNGVITRRRWRWCAVGASGAVYCSGLNSHGQAGDGTKDHAYQPVKVDGLPAPATEVKTMPLSTCALLTTGKIHCWGNNAYGQLGSALPKAGSLSPREVVLP